MIEITDNFLQRLAGEPTFRRGLDYFRHGHVESLSVSNSRVTATVVGTHAYTVVLKHTAKSLDGVCNCPASDGMDFCKHCVAVALAYVQQQADITQLSGGGKDDQLKAYLLQLDKTQLLAQLTEIINSDNHLKKIWLQKAELALGKKDGKTLKKLITQALPYRSLWGHREAMHYFVQAESLLQPVIEQCQQMDAEQSFILQQYAYQRLNKALERIDDSGGARFGLESILGKALVADFSRLPWTPSQKADWLLEQTDHNLDVFPAVPEAFLANNVLPEVAKIYYQQLQVRWEALPPLSPNAADEKHSKYYQLLHHLLHHASESKDLARIIALKGKVAIHADAYLELIVLNVERNDFSAAEFWLAKIKRETKRDTNKVLPLQAEIILLQAQQRYTEALTLQWKKFYLTRQCSDYLETQRLTERVGGSVQGGYQQAEEYLIQYMKQNQPRFPWDLPSYELMEFYFHHQQFEKALQIAQGHKVNQDQLYALAQNIVQSHTEEAVQIYRSMVIELVNTTDNKAYRKAATMLVQLKTELDKLSDARWQSMFQKLLTEIRNSLKRKRNFIIELDKAFG